MNTNKATKQNTTPFVDDLFNQMANISKAHAYDIVSKDAGRYRKALEDIVNLKYENGMSRSYIETILAIAKEALKPQL